MNVADMMTAKPATIDQDASLRVALMLMEEIGCHHLPVTGHSGHLIGIISDRDCRTALNSPYIMRENWQDEELVDRLSVRAIMTPAPITTEPDTPAEEATRLMLDQHISCLPVLREETLVGIITTSDVLIAFMQLLRRKQPLPVNVSRHQDS